MRPRTPSWRRSAARSAAAGLPDIQVAALDALHLEVLARCGRRARAVEIGTLGGYSGVALLRGMAPDGELDTIELSERHAEVARESFRRAGVAARRAYPRRRRGGHPAAGRAAGSVRPGVHRRRQGGLSRIPRLGGHEPAPGGVVLLDNAFLFGSLADAPSGDRGDQIRAMQSVHETLARSGKFRATVLPTGRRPRLRRPHLADPHPSPRSAGEGTGYCARGWG
jgi:caffeoyl-CoA O-methyltransferase